MIHQAQKLQNQYHIKLFGSAWSPPAWMKTSHQLNEGAIRGKPGEKYYQLFAEYLVCFLNEYSNRNTSIWGLTVLNEPDICHEHDPKFPSICLSMNGIQQRDFIKHNLGPLLFGSANKTGHHKDLILMAYDFNLDHIENFVTPILTDPEASKYIAGIGFHWYSTNDATRRQLDNIHQRYPNKFLLATEASLIGKGVGNGDWAKFNHYVDDIMKDLNQNSVGWVDWSLAKDPQGNPNWVHSPVDPAVIIDPSVPEYIKQPMYYAVGHFSRFIPPGSIRLHHSLLTIQQKHSTETSEATEVIYHSPTIQVTVFSRPDNGTVVQVFNPTKHPYTILIHDHDHHNNSMMAIVEAEALKTFIYYY